MTNTHAADDGRIQHTLAKVSAAGYKLTAPRIAVLHAIHAFDGVFSAAEIEVSLRDAGHPLGDAKRAGT